MLGRPHAFFDLAGLFVEPKSILILGRRSQEQNRYLRGRRFPTRLFEAPLKLGDFVVLLSLAPVPLGVSGALCLFFPFALPFVRTLLLLSTLVCLTRLLCVGPLLTFALRLFLRAQLFFGLTYLFPRLRRIFQAPGYIRSSAGKLAALRVDLADIAPNLRLRTRLNSAPFELRDVVFEASLLFSGGKVAFFSRIEIPLSLLQRHFRARDRHIGLTLVARSAVAIRYVRRTVRRKRSK